MDKDLPDAGGLQPPVCDSCHAEYAAELTIGLGDRLATVRCDSCGAYGNPRGFSGMSTYVRFYSVSGA